MLPVVVPDLQPWVGYGVVTLHFPLAEVHLAEARIGDEGGESAGTCQQGATGEWTAIYSIEGSSKACDGFFNAARFVGEGVGHADIGAAVACAGLYGDGGMANSNYLKHRASAVMQNDSSESRAVAPQQSPVYP